MFNVVTIILAAAAFLPVLVLAQEPIYVPFEWSQVPLTATIIGSSGGTTSYALIDGGGRATPGPATLIQGPSGVASMVYVNSAAASPTTLSGICNLVSPVAVCTLNVQVTGAPLPGTAPTSVATGTNTKKVSSSSTSKGTTGNNGSGSLSTRPTATIIAMSSIALGFCIALALLR